MKIPNGKDYIIYISITKTGTRTFKKIIEEKIKIIEFLRNNGKRVLNKKYKKGDFFFITHNDFINFNKKHPDIIKKSYIFTIVRNPYTKAVSGFNYLGCKHEKNILSLLKNEKYLDFVSNKIDYKLEKDRKMWEFFSLYAHFFLEQSDGLIKDGKLILDEILYFENYNEEVNKFLKKIEVIEEDINFPKLNQSKGSKDILCEESKKLIRERFKKDFELFGYQV